LTTNSLRRMGTSREPATFAAPASQFRSVDRAGASVQPVSFISKGVSSAFAMERMVPPR
jgi:hypothetical protein